MSGCICLEMDLFQNMMCGIDMESDESIDFQRIALFDDFIDVFNTKKIERFDDFIDV